MQSAYERLLKIYNFKKMVYKKRRIPEYSAETSRSRKTFCEDDPSVPKTIATLPEAIETFCEDKSDIPSRKIFENFQKNSRAESLLIYSQNTAFANRKCKKAAFPVG